MRIRLARMVACMNAGPLLQLNETTTRRATTLHCAALKFVSRSFGANGSGFASMKTMKTKAQRFSGTAKNRKCLRRRSKSVNTRRKIGAGEKRDTTSSGNPRVVAWWCHPPLLIFRSGPIVSCSLLAGMNCDQVHWSSTEGRRYCNTAR